VSNTLPGADVRGFYQALGIELPGWARREASVACFSAPDAHAHGDRDPSCSVNVETGAWHCWGCGAKGGAFDAALARGLDARQAFELKIAYGLAERDPERPRPSRRVPAARGADQRLAGQVAPRARPSLAMDERQLREASARLACLLWPPHVLRGEQRRVWSRAALLELGCGWERGRVLIPHRQPGRRAARRAALRPHARSCAEDAGRSGTQLGLIPHPTAEPSEWIVLV